MEDLFFLSSSKRKIQDNDYYKISILDLKNTQIFNIYKLVDNKSTQFVNSHKCFDNISEHLKFVIKRNNKISFDIK